VGFLAGMFLFAGYLLVYAATANHGAFATEPWAGVLADAYTDVQTDTGGESSPAPSSSSKAPRPRLPRVGTFTQK
jgi:hypothetical protein